MYKQADIIVVKFPFTPIPRISELISKLAYYEPSSIQDASVCRDLLGQRIFPNQYNYARHTIKETFLVFKVSYIYLHR